MEPREKIARTEPHSALSALVRDLSVTTEPFKFGGGLGVDMQLFIKGYDSEARRGEFLSYDTFDEYLAMAQMWLDEKLSDGRFRYVSIEIYDTFPSGYVPPLAYITWRKRSEPPEFTVFFDTDNELVISWVAYMWMHLTKKIPDIPLPIFSGVEDNIDVTNAIDFFGIIAKESMAHGLLEIDVYWSNENIEMGERVAKMVNTIISGSVIIPARMFPLDLDIFKGLTNIKNIIIRGYIGPELRRQLSEYTRVSGVAHKIKLENEGFVWNPSGRSVISTLAELALTKLPQSQMDQLLQRGIMFDDEESRWRPRRQEEVQPEGGVPRWGTLLTPRVEDVPPPDGAGYKCVF